MARVAIRAPLMCAPASSFGVFTRCPNQESRAMQPGVTEAGKIARVQANKNMPEENKAEALSELNNALKSPAPPVENKGNIDLVTKYYDKLAAIMGDDQQ